MEFFFDYIKYKNVDELKNLYYYYYLKRLKGDHTTRTLNKIQILNRKLLKLGLLGAK